VFFPHPIFALNPDDRKKQKPNGPKIQKKIIPPFGSLRKKGKKRKEQKWYKATQTYEQYVSKCPGDCGALSLPGSYYMP
jgi:hypothetical protein